MVMEMERIILLSKPWANLITISYVELMFVEVSNTSLFQKNLAVSF